MDLSKYMTLSYLLSWANIMGFIGGVFYVGTMVMKTMVPLRAAAIASNFFLGLYGLLANSLPTVFLYTLLLPINCVRLYQMIQLVEKVKIASQGDLSMDWLKPFMHKHSYKQGAVLFRKGDHAEEMFYIVSGHCRINELGLELSAGHMVGELGFITPEHQRTQTVECIDDVEMLAISYDKVRELYFQNPSFGFYLLRLASERLLQNVDRMERVIEAHNRAAPA